MQQKYDAKQLSEDQDIVKHTAEFKATEQQRTFKIQGGTQVLPTVLSPAAAPLVTRVGGYITTCKLTAGNDYIDKDGNNIKSLSDITKLRNSFLSYFLNVSTPNHRQNKK